MVNSIFRLANDQRLGSARLASVRFGWENSAYMTYMPSGEGDYMSMIMFIFHFIKSCDDDDDECFVCPTCHAVTLNLCNFLEKCWVKKSLTTRNWYFQLILSILLVYFVEFLFGFGINLILLFNQMHCTIQKREGEEHLRLQGNKSQ